MKKIFIIMLFIISLVRAPSVYADEVVGKEWWMYDGVDDYNSSSGNHVFTISKDIDNNFPLANSGFLMELADFGYLRYLGSTEDYYYVISQGVGSTAGMYSIRCVIKPTLEDGQSVICCPTKSTGKLGFYILSSDGSLTFMPTVDLPAYLRVHVGGIDSSTGRREMVFEPSKSQGAVWGDAAGNSAYSTSTEIVDSNIPVYLIDDPHSNGTEWHNNFNPSDDEPSFSPVEPEKDYVVDLEVPQNLKVSGQWLCKDTLTKTKHGQLKFSWDISEEVLAEYNINDIPWATTFDMYVKSKYCKNGVLHLFDEWVESDKYLFQQQFATLYNVRSLHQDFGCEVPISSYTYSEGSTLLGGCSSSDFSVEPVACQFRIRNYYDDGKVIHISNWLVVYIDKDGDDDIIRIQEQEPSEDELNGINLKDDGTVSSTGLPDYNSDYDINNSYTAEPITGAGLTDSVKTGFGLLGKNGVLAFFSDYFTYVPDWFFSLILTSLEIIIAIAIIKLAL